VFDFGVGLREVDEAMAVPENVVGTIKQSSPPKKVIIDTDPGIDDAMAIFFALKSPELDVIALTTIYGNVRTPTATVNALHLLEFAGREDIPVSEGFRTSLRGELKERIADFVHGADGLGNTYPTLSDRKPIDTFAPDYLIQKVNEFPGEITIVALGPLTNLAAAVECDPTFAKKVGQIIILGGAFQVNGNVNPAAEANIYGDPEAADIIFTCGADILVVGINITHQVYWTGKDLEDLGRSDSKFGKYLYAASHFYATYHREAYDIDAIYLHDPATMVAAVDPSLMTYATGAVRVQKDGICKGLTLFNNSNKVWHDPTDWCGIPPVKVAVTVDRERVASLLKERLTAP
jgi:inosine-uridine nucleoside N-ribohydrolase